MGCDMHAILEERNEEGKWEMVREFDVDRQYALFAHLADIRNDGTISPICPPRGWPVDGSLGAQKLRERWRSDGHSASHLTGAELATHRFFYDKEPMKLPYWLREIIIESSKNQRLVFCFDN